MDSWFHIGQIEFHFHQKRRTTALGYFEALTKNFDGVLPPLPLAYLKCGAGSWLSAMIISSEFKTFRTKYMWSDPGTGFDPHVEPTSPAFC